MLQVISPLSFSFWWSGVKKESRSFEKGVIPGLQNPRNLDHHVGVVRGLVCFNDSKGVSDRFNHTDPAKEEKPDQE